MTISEMLSQSGILTLLGMGVVFSFLIIMILAKLPSDLIRNASGDTQLILFCLCVISDIHIFLRCLNSEGK